MNARITAVAAIAAAHKATTSLSGLWADAYAATAKDVEGGATLRDISDALRKAGVKASKDIVGDFALAATLTASPYFAAAHAEKVGADRIMLPHSLITKARVARGVAYVRGVLATLEGLEGEDLEKATRKAVRDLHAAKREAKPDPQDEATTGEETGEEAAPTMEEAAPAEDEATSDTRLSSVIKPLERVLADWQSGTDIPSPEAVTAFLAVAARLVTMARDSAKVA